MQDVTFTSDIFVIGGGINGVAIATDAAGRGLSVTLCEKNDLASATSSASSKLIHGGLRYLESYEFGLVRKALKERELLLKNAPYLISSLEFVLPHEQHLRPEWMIRLGLFLYDHLAAHPLLPHSKSLDLQNSKYGEPLQSIFKKGFSYYDCRVDDARLVVTNAIRAKEKGATILTRTLCTAAEFQQNRWKITLCNTRDQSVSTVYAKYLINAAGPWVDDVQTKVNEKPMGIRLIKGSHIVVPRFYEDDFAYILQTADQRVVFVIPYLDNYSLIGTTDVEYTGNINEIQPSEEEVAYLCQVIQHYFKKSVTPDQVRWSYAGVRCLQDDHAAQASRITRDYKLVLNKEKNALTVIGGKMTTHRCLAEEVLSQITFAFPQMKTAWTAHAPLPGGDYPDASFNDFYQRMKKHYAWLPETLLKRYLHTYGSRIDQLVGSAQQLSDLGRDLGAELYEQEVRYLLAQEWAESAEDILWRRTKLGLAISPSQALNLNQYIQQVRMEPAS